MLREELVKDKLTIQGFFILMLRLFWVSLLFYTILDEIGCFFRFCVLIILLKLIINRVCFLCIELGIFLCNVGRRKLWGLYRSRVLASHWPGFIVILAEQFVAHDKVENTSVLWAVPIPCAIVETSPAFIILSQVYDDGLHLHMLLILIQLCVLVLRKYM